MCHLLRSVGREDLYPIIRTVQGIYINGLKLKTKTKTYTIKDIKDILFWRKRHPKNVLLDNGILNQICEEDLIIFISIFDYLFKVEGNKICNKPYRFADTKYISAVLQCIISVLKNDPIRKYDLSSSEIQRIRHGSITLMKMQDERMIHEKKMRDIQMSYVQVPVQPVVQQPVQQPVVQPVVQSFRPVHLPLPNPRLNQPLRVWWSNIVNEQCAVEQGHEQHEQGHEQGHEQMQYEDTVPPYNPEQDEAIRVEHAKQMRVSNLSGIYHGLVAKCTILNEKPKRTLSEQYELIQCIAERDATHSELLAHI